MTEKEFLKKVNHTNVRFPPDDKEYPWIEVWIEGNLKGWHNYKVVLDQMGKVLNEQGQRVVPAKT